VIKIKVGVIGTGRWGKKHIQEYSKMRDVEVTWISDIVENNLKQCKKQYNIENVTTNYNEVLSSDIESVSICTSNESHFKICRDALQSGKHVLVEKPITLQSKKAYELIDLAKENKRLLGVGHIYRYNNAINEAKKLIQKDYFGDLFYLRLQWTIQWLVELYPDKHLDIIVDMMPHMYDIMNNLIGLWPKKITCFGKDFMKKGLEDTAFIICEFSNNIMSYTEISWTLPVRVREIAIIGRKASAKIRAITQELIVYEKSNDGRKIDIKPNNTLGDELKNFINAIKKGSKLSNNGEIGAKTVELVEATSKSLKLGKSIKL
jgi:UDP-N-acetylglucosamine 3-dehydrogenase